MGGEGDGCVLCGLISQGKFLKWPGISIDSKWPLLALGSYPQLRNHLLQLLVGKVNEALLSLNQDCVPGDFVLAVGDEVADFFHVVVQLGQRLLMHVQPAGGVCDIQGGLSNVTIDFGKTVHLNWQKETCLNIWASDKLAGLLFP